MNDHILIVFGLALGVIFTLVGVQTDWYSSLPNEMWSFLGTLIGASVTVFGAFFLSSLKDGEMRRRRLAGARAVLASDLHLLIEYAKKSAESAVRGGNYVLGKKKMPVICPELDHEVLLRLQNLIELLDRENAEKIVDLMHCYQVQRSRLKEIIMKHLEPDRASLFHVLDENSFIFTLQGTVELHLRATSIFPFARGECEAIQTPPYPEKTVHNSMRLLEVSDWLSRFKYDEHMTQYDHFVRLMVGIPSRGRWRK